MDNDYNNQFPFSSLIEFLLTKNLRCQGYNILPTLLDFTELSNIFYYKHGKSDMNDSGLFIQNPASISIIPEGNNSIRSVINQVCKYVQLCDTLSVFKSLPEREPFSMAVRLSVNNPFSSPPRIEYDVRNKFVLTVFRETWSYILRHKLPKKVKILRNVPIQVYIPPLGFNIKSIAYFKENDGRIIRFIFGGELNYYLYHPIL